MPAAAKTASAKSIRLKKVVNREGFLTFSAKRSGSIARKGYQAVFGDRFTAAFDPLAIAKSPKFAVAL
jgi:hypothetical protein